MAVTPPTVSIGAPKEYVEWVNRLREVMKENGAPTDFIEKIDARYNYRANQITLCHLPNQSDPLSIAQTLSHEFLHALLYWMGEGTAARVIDFIARPVGSSERVGGI